MNVGALGEFALLNVLVGEEDGGGGRGSCDGGRGRKRRCRRHGHRERERDGDGTASKVSTFFKRTSGYIVLCV